MRLRCTAWITALLWTTTALTAPYPGSVIDAFAPNFAAARGGIKLGDVIHGWSYVDSPEVVTALTGAFELRDLEREVHGIRPVSLHGVRNSEPIIITPEQGRWAMGARPNWPSDIAARYDALLLLASKDSDSAEIEAKKLANIFIAKMDFEDAAWLWLRLGGPLSKNGEWPKISRFYRHGVEALPEGEFQKPRGMLQYYLANTLVRHNMLEQAEIEFKKAIVIEREIASERLAIAANQVSLARLASRRGQLPKAMDLLEQALWLQHKLAPDSLLVASTHNEIGVLHLKRDDHDGAEASFLRAWEIANVRDPGGVSEAGYLVSRGSVDYYRGNLAAAEQRWTEGLQLKEKLEPGTRNVASGLHNLGLVNRERGDLREAQRYYRAALSISDRLEPDSLKTATTYDNLGSLALEQGDLNNAVYYHEKVYALRKEAVPGSLELVISLINLGNVSREQGDLDKSLAYHQEALEIQQRLSPETSQHARILASLGITAELQGATEKAKLYFLESLQLYRTIAPRTANVASAATLLGDVLLDGGDMNGAEARFDEARSILIDVAPDTFRAARAWHGLARVAEHRKETLNAGEFYENALSALDAQQLRLGGSDETRARARARYSEIYKDAVHFFIQTESVDHAFEVLERSRAKELSNMLAERDLVFAADIPSELEKQRRILAHRYESKQSALYAVTEVAQIRKIQTELLDIRRQQDALQRDIRDNAPGLAELHYPRPLALSELTTIVPTGTVVVAFNVDANHSDAFVVNTDGELTTTRLPVGDASLSDAVKRFRYLMDAGRFDSAPSPALESLALELYRQLLKPLERSLSDAEQLLIVPDGPLNVLPFAALRRHQTQYLAQWKPSLTTNSLGIFSQLRKRSVSAENNRLVAFGNPEYPPIAAAQENLGTRDGYDLSAFQPLPWSEAEVRNITRQYPNDKSAFLGSDATEEQAKALPNDTRILHFATHATLNAQRPLDSALVLSLPITQDSTRENGFLHAWEIYESLRINADLVTLSGCETALGGAFSGEGLIGLTRAFHYAGAATVLASLWSIDDRSTSELMTRFYSELERTENITKALQAAQIAMIRGEIAVSETTFGRVRRWLNDEPPTKVRAHPYHWAGFILNGRGD